MGDLVLIGLYELPHYLQREYNYVYYVFDVATCYFDLSPLNEATGLSEILDSIELLEILVVRLQGEISCIHLNDERLIRYTPFSKYAQIHGPLAPKFEIFEFTIRKSLQTFFENETRIEYLNLRYYEEIIQQRLLKIPDKLKMKLRFNPRPVH